jgi:hypothetical protein
MFTRCGKKWNGLGGVERHWDAPEKQKRQQGSWRYMKKNMVLPRFTYTLEVTGCQEPNWEKAGRASPAPTD